MANKRASNQTKGGIFAGLALALFICLAALQAVFSKLECQEFPTTNTNKYAAFSQDLLVLEKLNLA